MIGGSVGETRSAALTTSASPVVRSTAMALARRQPSESTMSCSPTGTPLGAILFSHLCSHVTPTMQRDAADRIPFGHEL